MGEPSKQLEMRTREVIVVREGGDFRDSCEDRVPPAVRRGPEPRETLAEEPAEQIREPTLTQDGILDRGPPGAGPKPRVASHAPARPGAAIEEERVHERESHKVADGLA